MGHVFKWTIKDVTDVLEGRIRNKFANFVVIDANGATDRTRIGKSTMAYILGRRTKTGTPFNPQRDIVYSRKESLKLLANMKHAFIISDEAINVAYKRNFFEEEQKDLIQCLNMYADSYNTYVMVLPDFWDLDVDLRKLVTLRFTMLERGIALVQRPRPSIFGKDPWDVKTNQGLENEWAHSKSRSPQYGKLTTCCGILYFNDLTPKQRAEYEAIKAEKRNKVFNKYSDNDLMLDPEQRFNKHLVEKVKAGKITPEMFDTIAELHGMKAESLRRKLNTMLKDEKDAKTYKDYVMTGDRKEKRDLLGFTN